MGGFRRVGIAMVCLACLSGVAMAQAPAATPKTPAATHAAAKAGAKSKQEAGKASDKTEKPGKPVALLPTDFAGWEADGAAKPITDPAVADAANAAALKEYGFTDALKVNYTREGATLPVTALRFADASGAYGAYSYYRKSNWPKEQVGAGAASDHNRVLFWQGNVVVDATFAHITGMSGAELRELAKAIPLPGGNRSLYPPILADLPQKDLDGQTTHYALGVAGYAGSGGVLPPEMVGFDRGAEAVTASYSLRSGQATLTLIDYPTPQMALAAEKTISAYVHGGGPLTKALQDSNPAALQVRRSGPLVAVVSGDAITDEAHKLIAGVHYEAEIASAPLPVDSEVKKTAQLIIGIIMLVVVMFVAALTVALFLGGGRAAFRIARGKPASSMYDQEFIKLDLE